MATIKQRVDDLWKHYDAGLNPVKTQRSNVARGTRILSRIDTALTAIKGWEWTNYDEFPRIDATRRKMVEQIVADELVYPVIPERTFTKMNQNQLLIEKIINMEHHTAETRNIAIQNVLELRENWNLASKIQSWCIHQWGWSEYKRLYDPPAIPPSITSLGVGLVEERVQRLEKYMPSLGSYLTSTWQPSQTYVVLAANAASFVSVKIQSHISTK